jgi:hypothetical protein
MQLSTKREFWRGVRARLGTHPVAHVFRRRRRSMVLCRHELNVRHRRQLRRQTPAGQRGAPRLSYLCDMLGPTAPKGMSGSPVPTLNDDIREMKGTK